MCSHASKLSECHESNSTRRQLLHPARCNGPGSIGCQMVTRAARPASRAAVVEIAAAGSAFVIRKARRGAQDMRGSVCDGAPRQLQCRVVRASSVAPVRQMPCCGMPTKCVTRSLRRWTGAIAHAVDSVLHKENDAGGSESATVHQLIARNCTCYSELESTAGMRCRGLSRLGTGEFTSFQEATCGLHPRRRVDGLLLSKRCWATASKRSH